uniref:ubiquitinyl hydrolase 1 n=1 Tax=Sinocyclocheilus anshuiensis TaxID=1608454 RepID=A0A671M4W1_9TELE
MESIFHEKQEGSLCAQHCLNNLLQGEYFSPVELSAIAQQLDEEERVRMAEGGVQTEEYRTFLQVLHTRLISKNKCHCYT